ncbi:MAG: hypothetical protein GXP16_03370 [Gammaproteobacteria bacterium]|nr:hypothetical protein [Gammaproteobacteria bacterium]
MKIVDEGRPTWFISPMFDQAKKISIEANSILLGYRMKPGVHIAENELLRSIQHCNNVDDVAHLLADFTHRSYAVEEALKCLASDI